MDGETSVQREGPVGGERRRWSWFLLASGQPVADNQMYLGVPSKADLTTAGGVAPDLITADGRTVQARYVVGSIRGGRCLVATWTEATFAVADGTDRQCSSGALILD